MANFFSLHQNDALTALRRLRARPLGNVLTIAVIALALTLPTCFYLVAKNVLMLSQQLPSSSQLTLYLTEDITSSQREALESRWTEWPEIDSVNYVSPDQGLEEFSAFHGFAKALPMLDNNPLPAVMLVEASSDSVDDVLQLAQRLSGEERVDDVRLDSDWIERFSAMQAVLMQMAGLFSVLMLLVVVLVIGNTLRLQVLNEKPRIQVMKLVGATDRDILRPYLYTGVWYGIIGAVIAWGLTFGVVMAVKSSVDVLAKLYGAAFPLAGMGLEETGLLLMTAMVLGIVAAQLSARRHLSDIEPV